MIRRYVHDIRYFLKTRPSFQALPWIHRFMGSLWDVYMIPSVSLFEGVVVTWRKSVG